MHGEALAADILWMGNSAATVSADAGLIGRLTSQGHTVTLMEVAAVSAEEQVAAANANDLVIISESISSFAVLTGADFNLKDYTRPILSFEVFMWDNAGWVGPVQNFDFGVSGRPNEQEFNHPDLVPLDDSLRIVNSSHPLAAGLTNGPHVVYTRPYTFNIANVGSDAAIIATVDSDTDPMTTYFVYEAGDTLYNDFDVTAGMRIGLFLGQYGGNSPDDPDGGGPPQFSYIGPKGLQLFDAAVNYAVQSQFDADFDNDGDVDGNDLAKWRTDFGANPGSDADGDGDSDGADFLIWQAQFGATGLGSITAVPEPGSLLSSVCGIVVLACRRRAVRARCREPGL